MVSYKSTSQQLFKVTFFTTDLTAIRDHYLPDASGTIALTSDIPSVDATPTDGSANAVSSNGVFDGLGTKQATLVSGTNIKTINGTTLLGSGDITVGGGIAVGTTAVTSGTIGRVFFQGTGNVVQQDADLFWDNANKRLGVGKTPAASSAKMVVAITDGTANQNYYLTLRNQAAGFGGWGFVKLGSNDLGITYETNTDAPSLGTSMRFYYGGNSAFGGSLSVGTLTTPAARLDVRAQGALSTDIAFRVRNSADSATIGYIAGNGLIVLGENASTAPTVLVNPAGSTRLLLRGGTNQDLSFSSSGFAVLNCAQGFDAVAGSTGSSQIRFRNGSGGNVSLFYGGLQIGTAQSASTATNFTLIANGVAPSVNYADSHYYYSADIVAGNAAPHFRTENGDIIKLYKQDSAGILTVGQLVTVLQNLGLLS